MFSSQDMQRIRCLIIVSLCCFTISGIKSQVEKRDSLLIKVQQSSGDEKLEYIRQLAISCQDTKELLPY